MFSAKILGLGRARYDSKRFGAYAVWCEHVEPCCVWFGKVWVARRLVVRRLDCAPLSCAEPCKAAISGTEVGSGVGGGGG